ncbi:hypothetical protein D3C71_2077910 [compost metagenome]
MTVADRRKKPDRQPNVQVLTGVDREAFMKLLFGSLERLDRKLLTAAGGSS